MPAFLGLILLGDGPSEASPDAKTLLGHEADQGGTDPRGDALENYEKHGIFEVQKMGGFGRCSEKHLDDFWITCSFSEVAKLGMTPKKIWVANERW